VRPWAVAILAVAVAAQLGMAEVGDANTTRTRPQLAGAGGHVVISGAGYKPRRFYPDQRTIASGFRWSTWSRTRAVGTGTTKTCAPGGLSCSTTRQSVTYTRPRRACGALTFTRFRYSKWPARGQLAVDGNACIWQAS